MEKKLFSEEECNLIIEQAESFNSWAHHTANGCSYWVITFPAEEFISDKIKKYTLSHLKLNVLNVNVGVLKYFENDYFGRHYDRRSSTEFNKDFVYNVNLRLNDNYEGGQFYLRDEPFHAQVGDVYHYKSTDWHEVKPVTSGIKYTGLFYIRERDLGINKLF